MENLLQQVTQLQEELNKLQPMLQNKNLGLSEVWVKKEKLENTLTNVFCKMRRLQREIEQELNQ